VEQDTGTWKQSALHAGAILFLENQDYGGLPLVDGAKVLSCIETDLMSGWSISHYSEREGLTPSLYPWPALEESTFINDWKTGEYSIVNWAGHGQPHAVWRMYWAWDDGDSVPESSVYEITNTTFISGSVVDLDTDHPSILFALSCNVGYPEPNTEGRLGIGLLSNPRFGAAVGVFAASRPAAATSDFITDPGGAQAIGYHFNRYMINGPDGPEKLGAAVYKAKHYSNLHFGWAHVYEYRNMYDYNLYGDPTMLQAGVSPPVPVGGIIHIVLLQSLLLIIPVYRIGR
jgi:hypothetical protein